MLGAKAASGFFQWMMLRREAMSTREILQKALSLPVEERVQIADSLLRSLNTPISAIDEQWLEVAVGRLQEIHSGKVEPIAGDRVFAEILERFSR